MSAGWVTSKSATLHVSDFLIQGMEHTMAQLTGGFWEQYMNIGTAYSLSGANTGTLPSGFVQTQAANPALKWETTEEINAGVGFLYIQK